MLKKYLCNKNPYTGIAIIYVMVYIFLLHSTYLNNTFLSLLRALKSEHLCKTRVIHQIRTLHYIEPYKNIFDTAYRHSTHLHGKNSIYYVLFQLFFHEQYLFCHEWYLFHLSSDASNKIAVATILSS